jgi:hypothetical protein
LAVLKSRFEGVRSLGVAPPTIVSYAFSAFGTHRLVTRILRKQKRAAAAGARPESLFLDCCRMYRNSVTMSRHILPIWFLSSCKTGWNAIGSMSAWFLVGSFQFGWNLVLS